MTSWVLLCWVLGFRFGILWRRRRFMAVGWERRRFFAGMFLSPLFFKLFAPLVEFLARFLALLRGHGLPALGVFFQPTLLFRRHVEKSLDAIVDEPPLFGRQLRERPVQV